MHAMHGTVSAVTENQTLSQSFRMFVLVCLDSGTEGEHGEVELEAVAIPNSSQTKVRLEASSTPAARRSMVHAAETAEST